MNGFASWLSQFAQVWAGTMLQALWQSALVALLIMAAVACLRRSSSPLRYGLLMVALIKFAIPPMLALPTGLFSRVEAPVAIVYVSPAPARIEPIAPPSQPVPAISPVQITIPRQTELANPVAATGVDVSAAPVARSNPFAAFHPASWLMLAHAAGAFTVALWIAWQMLALGRIAGRATQLTGGPAHALYLSIATSLGLRRVPRLLVIESGCAPVAFGVFRPVVLVPRRLIDNFDPGQLRAVLGHELAHHRRRDPLVIMIQLILLIVWWFNPIYWLVVRSLRKVREDCCDDLLLARELTSNETYCETLLRTGRELTHALPAGAALGFAESIHPLARRLRRIMDTNIRRSRQLSLVGLVAVMALAAIVLPGTRPRAEANATPAKPAANVAGKSQAMLSGRITDEDELEYLGIPKVRGVVINAETSQPLAAYQVRVRKVRSFDDHHVPDGRWQTVSNPDGRFELEMVGPGVFQIQAMAEGLAPRWSPEFDTRTDADKMLRIELTPGASAKGKVLDQQGKPIAGAKVIPLSKASGIFQDELNQFKTDGGAVMTAADGSFAFEHLTPGAETFKVVHPGHSPVEMNNIKLKEGAVTVIAARKLTSGGTLQGRVYDNEGNPQPGVKLEIRNMPGIGSSPGLLASVVTDASGGYRARNLPAELIYVQREDQWNCPGVTINAILAVDGQVKTLDLGGGGIVTGRLVDNGKPLPGAIMNIHSDAPYGGTFTTIARTGNEGKFTLNGVPAGRRTLYCVRGDKHKGAPVEMKSFDFDPKITTRLDLGEVSPPRAIVRIKVLNEDPATTYSAQRVFICADRENEIGGRAYGWTDPMTDPNAPIVVRGVPPGKYAASVMRGDLVTFREFFPVAGGASDVNVTIRMPRGASGLHANYVDTKPRLIVMSKDRRVFGFITPDQANNSLSRLPAGRYLIHNISFDSLRPVKEFTLPPGETLMMNIEEPWFATPTKGMLDVQVFTSEGMPLPGAKVWLESDGEKTEAQQVADHHYVFTAKAGGCTIHAGYPHFRAVELNSVLPPVFEPYPQSVPKVRVILERE